MLLFLEDDDTVPNGVPRKRTISENRQLKKSTSRQLSKQVSKVDVVTDDDKKKEEEVCTLYFCKTCDHVTFVYGKIVSQLMVFHVPRNQFPIPAV